MIPLTSQQKSPPNIFLAEDDEEMRKMVAMTLRKAGYSVVEARNGLELAEYLVFRAEENSNFIPDLIISDIRMPGINGLSFLSSYREENRATPVLLITAFGDSQVREDAQRLGAAGVLDKPFDLDELKRLVLDLVPPG